MTQLRARVSLAEHAIFDRFRVFAQRPSEAYRVCWDLDTHIARRRRLVAPRDASATSGPNRRAALRFNSMPLLLVEHGNQFNLDRL